MVQKCSSAPCPTHGRAGSAQRAGKAPAVAVADARELRAQLVDLRLEPLDLGLEPFDVFLEPLVRARCLGELGEELGGFGVKLVDVRLERRELARVVRAPLEFSPAEL